MRFYVSQSGIRAPKWLFAFIAASIGAILTVTMLPSDAVAATVPTPEVKVDESFKNDSDGDGDLDRPDRVSAALSARMLKKPVEDMSSRSETDRTLVNQDGSVTLEKFGAAVRVQDEKTDKWEDVNFDLEPTDKGFAPVASAQDLVVGGGGSAEAARLTMDDGSSMAVSWPTELPEPTIKGGVATYKLSDATDLIVSVTSTGVATRIRLNKAPTAHDPVFTLGLRTDDLNVAQVASGGLKMTDDKGKQVGATTSLMAWDADMDSAGDPKNVVPVTAELTDVSVKGDVTKHDLTLSLPEGYLSDPERSWPITIDPDLAAMTPSQDTWVRSGTTVTNGGLYRTWVGRIHDSTNTNPAITYMQWANTQLADKTIVKAKMGLYQYESGSCDPKTVSIAPLAAAFNESTTVYTNRPAVRTGTGDDATLTVNRGKNDCAGTAGTNGFVEADITNIVDAWAKGSDDGGYPNYGLQLSVPSADLTLERRWCSANLDAADDICKVPSLRPYLKVTYNSAPSPAATPSVDTSMPSRTFDGKLYVSSTKPLWSSSAADPEMSRLTLKTEVHTSKTDPTVVAECTSAEAGAAEAATCASTTALTNGSTYFARTMATDSFGLTGEWSPWTEFVVDTTNPTTPSIDCTDYTDGQWYLTLPAPTTTCTVTAAAGTDIDWKFNGEQRPDPLTLSGGTATTPALPVDANGYTEIEGRTRTRAGAVTAYTRFSFGAGGAVLNQPVQDDRSTSTFPVEATGAPGATSAKIQWRFAPDTAGDVSSDWKDADHVRVASDPDPVHRWNGGVTGTDKSVTPKLSWDPRGEPGINAPALVQVRVVFTYPDDSKKSSPLQRIQVLPHAFGGSFPTQDFGPGQAALFTGEFQLSQTDVDVPGYGEALTLGRSHLSFASDATGQTGVFGPGWVADLTGGESGVAGFKVIDRTDVDGSIQLFDPEGTSSVYQHTSKTKGALKVGTYTGVGETALDEDNLTLATVTGITGATHRLTLNEWDGTKTSFLLYTAGGWRTEKVVSPEATGTTTYAYDAEGSVTWIFAPAPAGVNCNVTARAPGCRALQIFYTGTGTNKRLTEVKLNVWDPKTGTDGKPGAGAAMTAVSVAKYTYDSGKLIAAWDPRLGDDAAALKTEYDYTTVNDKTKLSKVTEPGLKPWRFEYDDEGRIEHIERDQDAAVEGGEAVWTVEYDLALDGENDGLPNMSADATKAWGQAGDDAPYGGTAVFGPDKTIGDSISADDREYADLSYFTRVGRTTNTASFGAGAWQIDTDRYDTTGNTVWSLSAEGRRQALIEGGSNIEVSAGAADKYATWTVYNATGTRVENTFGPTRSMVLKNGTTIVGRTTTETVYDNESGAAGLMPGRPTTGVPADGFGLAVEERSSVTDKASPGAPGSLFDTELTRYRYDKVIATDGDGWVLKTPTRVLEQNGAGWATTLTRFDTEGKVVETRTPQGTETVNNTATDTRSTKTVYYTADTSASRNECDSKPQWVGLVCWHGPGATLAGLPETSNTGYSMMLAPTRVEDFSGTAKRVDVSTFDAGGRPVKSATTTSGLATADRVVPESTTTYSPTTGAVTSVTNGTNTQTTTYDSWGRVLTQTDGKGNTASTSYDSAGRVKSTDDGKGVTTYTYDGDDASGKKERRGLVTKTDVGIPDVDSTFTGAYDAAGNLVKQTLPGDWTADSTYDMAGSQKSLNYSQDGSPMVSYLQNVDSAGRVRHEWGVWTDKDYSYDDRDRLTKVTDRYWAWNQCFTRDYGFSGDSNRTSLKSYDPASDGTCQSTTPVKTVTSTFDSADRITGGYIYDGLGRTTTVPGSDTNNQKNDVVVGYHANDMVATMSQIVYWGVTEKQDYTLDVAGRVSEIKKLQNVGAGDVSLEESINHYDGSSDSPAWAETKTRPDAATGWTSGWTRYVGGLDGDLAISQSSDGTATMQLPNMHGDVALTSILGSSGINHLSEYNEYDEYGTHMPKVGRYGWLGAKQRDATAQSGITLMGARLYNPVTGRFLTRDPVEGGNDNTYTYPADPINQLDLDGRFKKFWKSRKFWKRGAFAVGFGVCVVASAGTCLGVGLATAGVGAYASAKKKGKWGVRKRKFYKELAWGAGSAAVGFGVGRPFGKAFDRMRRGKYSYGRLTFGLGSGTMSVAAGNCARYWKNKSSYGKRTCAPRKKR